MDEIQNRFMCDPPRIMIMPSLDDGFKDTDGRVGHTSAHLHPALQAAERPKYSVDLIYNGIRHTVFDPAVPMQNFSNLAYMIMIYTKAVRKIENDCREEFHCGGMEGIPRLESRQVFG